MTHSDDRDSAAERDATQESITSLVRSLLRIRGPKQSDLASAIHMSESTLSTALSPTSRRRRQWQPHEVVAIARHYRISTDALLGNGPARKEVEEELTRLANQKIREGSWDETE